MSVHHIQKTTKVTKQPITSKSQRSLDHSFVTRGAREARLAVAFTVDAHAVDTTVLTALGVAEGRPGALIHHRLRKNFSELGGGADCGSANCGYRRGGDGGAAVGTGKALDTLAGTLEADTVPTLPAAHGAGSAFAAVEPFVRRVAQAHAVVAYAVARTVLRAMPLLLLSARGTKVAHVTHALAQVATAMTIASAAATAGHHTLPDQLAVSAIVWPHAMARIVHTQTRRATAADTERCIVLVHGQALRDGGKVLDVPQHLRGVLVEVLWDVTVRTSPSLHAVALAVRTHAVAKTPSRTLPLLVARSTCEPWFAETLAIPAHTIV